MRIDPLNVNPKMNTDQTPLLEIWRSLPAVPESDLRQDWALDPNYYGIYRAIGRALQPSSILEIGTRVGYSLIALMCDDERIQKVRFVDNETYIPNSNDMAERNIKAFLATFSPQRRGPDITSSVDYPVPASLAGSFTLAHIDGEHSYEGKIRDLDFVEAVAPEIVLIDDYDYHDCCKRAVLDWSSRHDRPLYYIQTLRGMALIDRSRDAACIAKIRTLLDVSLVNGREGG